MTATATLPAKHAPLLWFVHGNLLTAVIGKVSVIGQAADSEEVRHAPRQPSSLHFSSATTIPQRRGEGKAFKTQPERAKGSLLESMGAVCRR